MKKMISLLLVVALFAAMAAGCAQKPAEETTEPTTEATTQPTTEATTEPTTEATEEVSDPTQGAEAGSLEAMINEIIAIQPVEFMAATTNLDLTDTSENAAFQLKGFTGLDDASILKEVSAYESMIGSIAFSMVLVRVNDAANAKTVGEKMKDGIDPRKWICVEADDLQVVGCGDVVMLIMVSSAMEGMTSQAFVDAFQTVCGAELDFVLK